MHRGRRAVVVALVLALAAAGCTSQVRGNATPSSLPPPAGGPGQGAGAQAVGDLELTPLAALPSRAGQALLHVGLRVRNTGGGMVRFTSTTAKLTDSRGTAAGTVTTPDPAYPPFPPAIALGPGQTIIGYLTYTVSPPFQPGTLRFQTASWPVNTIPRDPMGGTLLPPKRTAPLGQPVTINGTDNTADPAAGKPPAPVELLVRALKVTDPAATGSTAPPGYRIVTVTFLVRNIGPNPYWTEPPTSMWALDGDGYAYPAVASPTFPTSVLPRGATKTGEVLFPVPQRARLSYLEISVTTGDPAAIAQWTAR
jgi:hypothetical protein